MHNKKKEITTVQKRTNIQRKIIKYDWIRSIDYFCSHGHKTLRMYFVKSSGTCELSSLIAWRTKMIERRKR